MKLREALIQQGPSLTLQRAAGDEIARLDGELVKAKARALTLMMMVDRLSLAIDRAKMTLRANNQGVIADDAIAQLNAALVKSDETIESLRVDVPETLANPTVSAPDPADPVVSTDMYGD